MNKLLTFGIDKIDENLFNPVSNYTEYDCRNKPMGGGLWASPYKPNNEFVSDWLYWIKYNLSEESGFRKFVGVTYNLKSNSKVLEIDTLNDYLDVLDKYGHIPFPKYSGKMQLNFEAMSKDYDVFHLTENAVNDLRFLFGEAYHLAEDFYYYDVESYILFNLDCIDKDSIEVITLPEDFWNLEEDDE